MRTSKPMYVLIGFLFANSIIVNISARDARDLSYKDVTVELEVYVDGKKVLSENELAEEIAKRGPIDEEERVEILKKGDIPIRKGDSAQLTVEMIEKNGRVTDVTDSPYIIYDGTGEWTLSVNETGLVTASPEPDWADSVAAKEYGYGASSVLIIFKHDDKVGINGVTFDVVE